MPTYEYQCTNCGHELEAFQKMSDEPLVICPKCDGTTLTRLVSAPSFHLKGSGWYVTDIKNKDKPKTEKKESTESKTDDTKKENKSETQKSSESNNSKAE